MSDARQIRPLTAAEAGTLVGWAAGEGWNPGEADAEAFYAADAKGFLGCFIGGELISGIAAIAYGDHFGFIGLYICRPDMRGRGHGRVIWDAGMARLAGRTVGLDGVEAQQANYRSMGFADAYRTVRYSGRPRLGGGTAVPVTPELVPAILAYDRGCFPAPREAFMRLWLAEPRRPMAVLRDGRVAGFGVLRRCGEGYKLGPLFADGEAEAKELLASLTAGLEDAIHIDVPAPQQGFVQTLTAASFTPGFTTTRMYRGAPPDVAMGRVFGVTTLELG